MSKLRIVRSVDLSIKWLTITIIVLSLLVVNAIAHMNDSSSGSTLTRIYGGEEIAPGEFPFLASVADGYCGGVIIDKRHILTAGHCVTDYYSVAAGEQIKSAEVMQVRIGMHYKPNVGDGIYIPIESIKIHNRYHHIEGVDAPTNDIAILRTKTPMPFSIRPYGRGAVGPIKLPPKSPIKQAYIENEMLTVVGWGSTNTTINGKNIPSPVPRKVNIPTLPLGECIKKFGHMGNDYDLDVQICAGSKDGSRDSCHGDSGGPLFRRSKHDFELVGLVSYGGVCGQVNRLGVYTRVDKFIDWIEANK